MFQYLISAGGDGKMHSVPSRRQYLGCTAFNCNSHVANHLTVYKCACVDLMLIVCAWVRTGWALNSQRRVIQCLERFPCYSQTKHFPFFPETSHSLLFCAISKMKKKNWQTDKQTGTNRCAESACVHACVCVCFARGYTFYATYSDIRILERSEPRLLLTCE